MRALYNQAEQRHVASMYKHEKIDLDRVDFDSIINSDEATPFVAAGASPWPWNPAVGSRVAGADAGVDDEPTNLRQAQVKARLRAQWAAFKLVANAGCPHSICIDDFFFDAGKTTQRPKPMAWYWIRTRPHWQDLSELMLYWLTAAVSTAGLERGFSFQTLIDQDTRRRRQGTERMRDDMIVHLHRKGLNTLLAAAI
jgi:hypothetical protein